MIDRTWWIWQQLDLKTRTGEKGISGTGTFLNSPPLRKHHPRHAHRPRLRCISCSHDERLDEHHGGTALLHLLV